MDPQRSGRGAWVRFGWAAGLKILPAICLGLSSGRPKLPWGRLNREVVRGPSLCGPGEEVGVVLELGSPTLRFAVRGRRMRANLKAPPHRSQRPGAWHRRNPLRRARHDIRNESRVFLARFWTLSALTERSSMTIDRNTREELRYLLSGHAGAVA
jgi:hypothetical protein